MTLQLDEVTIRKIASEVIKIHEDDKLRAEKEADAEHRKQKKLLQQTWKKHAEIENSKPF